VMVLKTFFIYAFAWRRLVFMVSLKKNHAIKKLYRYNLQPFTLTGCGGYIYGEGIISTPNYLSSSGIVECFWFVETRQSEDTILMRNNFSDIKITALLSRTHPEMIASLHIYRFFSLLIFFLLFIFACKKTTLGA
jgi:hypothetical protein